ncbi:MAG: hypothetical protein IPJ84_20010 [Bdellovibrionales bacterium]|nr:hypothetical protein [Bdellovibrionales bacterium]
MARSPPTWSLGVWVDQPFENTAIETLTPVIGKKLKGIGHQVTTTFTAPPTSDGAVLTLPDLHLKAVSAIKELSTEELHDAFLRSWTIHSSKQGFKTVPKSPTAILKLSSSIQLQSSIPILWSHLKTESRTLFAFAGTVVDEKTSQSFLKLIRSLNSGKTCQIRKFLKGTSAKQELSYLQRLVNAGAIDLAQSRD